MSARFAGAQRFLHQARAMVAVMIHGLQTAFLIVFPALAIVAALSDATSMTIPNWISAALALVFLPAALLASGPAAAKRPRSHVRGCGTRGGSGERDENGHCRPAQADNRYITTSRRSRSSSSRVVGTE